jgi:hypothetical protein
MIYYSGCNLIERLIEFYWQPESQTGLIVLYCSVNVYIWPELSYFMDFFLTIVQNESDVGRNNNGSSRLIQLLQFL